MSTPKLQLAARAGLPLAARRVHAMRAVPAVFLRNCDELARLREQVARLTRERDAAVSAAAARAQRAERVRAVTLRVVDGRAAFAAKQARGRAPLVIVHPHSVQVVDS
jgi:hypothetical protein